MAEGAFGFLQEWATNVSLLVLLTKVLDRYECRYYSVSNMGAKCLEWLWILFMHVDAHGQTLAAPNFPGSDWLLAPTHKIVHCNNFFANIKISNTRQSPTPDSLQHPTVSNTRQSPTLDSLQHPTDVSKAYENTWTYYQSYYNYLTDILGTKITVCLGRALVLPLFSLV